MSGVDSLHVATNGVRVLTVDEHEYGLIVSGLRKMRRKLSADQRRNAASGFSPDEGRADVAALRLGTLAKLMDRLGISGRGDGQ